ncbi:MAG: electron transfer flavoprotein beta subunit/FixA family protein [Ilumatobacteraceae bacterium]
MKILVCVKRVPAPGARISITADGQAIDTAFLGFTMSPHEECAVEEAVQLVERHGGDATVLTLGPAEADEQLRYAASLGVANAVLLPIDGADWDPQRTAAAIAAAIADIEAARGPFDLILFGNESADSGGFQVGVRVAHALGRPIVNGIKGIELQGDTLRARREADVGVEVYEVPMPAVLGVKEGINLPRYPTLKGRLASKKVAVAQVTPSAEPGGQQMVTLLPAAEQVSATVILGNGPDAAAAVVDMLQEIGVVK